jgi:hypothetical protein
LDNYPYFSYHPDLFPTYKEAEVSYRNHAWHPFRPLSVPNPDLLVKSAKSSQPLLIDANKVVNILATSISFSTRLMSAAQESKIDTVKDMIRKTGVKVVPDITYNPDGIRFDFHPITGMENCHIIITLNWKEF